MNAIRFKTKPFSGITGKVNVFLDEDTGAVQIIQTMIVPKNGLNKRDDLRHCEILREGKNYIVIQRLIHLHRKTFGVIIYGLSNLIEKNNLIEKFPTDFK